MSCVSPRCSGAITGRRKLTWRYRWSDAMRDDVFNRGLALKADLVVQTEGQQTEQMGLVL